MFRCAGGRQTEKYYSEYILSSNIRALHLLPCWPYHLLLLHLSSFRKAGSPSHSKHSSPLPDTVRAFNFVMEQKKSSSCLVDSGRIVRTHGRRVWQLYEYKINKGSTVRENMPVEKIMLKMKQEIQFGTTRDKRARHTGQSRQFPVVGGFTLMNYAGAIEGWHVGRARSRQGDVHP